MTWESLIDRVLTSFSPEVPRVKVKKYLQEAEENFSLGTKCYVKDWAFMPSSPDSFIDLPTDFVELVGQVEFKTITLDRVAHFEGFSRFKTDGTVKTGNPEYYFIRGEKMHLYPALSDAGLITFSYVAKPTHLEDSSTQYDYLRYDGLISDQFYNGDSILGLTSAAEADVADVVRISQKTGYLVLENISGTFQNNERIVATDDEQGMWFQSMGSDWDLLLESWDSLGLRGQAIVLGTIFNFDAGNGPLIPEIYHPHIVCYAKAAISEDTGDYSQARAYRIIYEADKEQSRVQSLHKGLDGVQSVIDVFGNAFI